MYVVFGASGGIGAELCSRLAAQPGAQVVLAGRDESKLAALQGRLPGGGANTLVAVADVTDSAQVGAGETWIGVEWGW